MAKVVCPLMSISAKGQFGKGAINFQSNHGDTQVRHLRQQTKKEPSPKQKTIRDNMALLVATWHRLHFVDIEHWKKIIGDPRGYRKLLPYYTPRNGYHLFIRRNMQYLDRGAYAIISPFSEMTITNEGTCNTDESIIF